MTRPRPRGAGFVLLLAMIAGARVAGAQPYARFAVPDTLLPDAVRSSGGQFEAAWNALLVAELRASAARADSAKRLAMLAGRIARVETGTLGSRISPDAWALRARWRADERRARVRAAVAESLAAAAQAGRDWGTADSLYQRALVDYRKIGERRRTAWVLGSLEVVAVNAGDLARADSLCRMALNARRAIGDAKMEGNSLFDLGNIALRSGRPADAYAWYRQAYEVRGRTGEISRQGAALRGLANAMLALGNADSALALYPQAAYLTSSGADSARTLEALGSWAEAVAQWRSPAEAIPLFERAVAIARERGDRGNEASLLASIGSARRAMGDFAEAAALYQQVELIDLAQDDSQHLARTLIDEGQAWIGLQDAASARGPLLRARALADSLAEPALQAAALDNLGHVARLEADYPAAARFGAQALEAAQRSGDPEIIHSVSSGLGALAFAQHQLEDAARHFATAAEAGTTLGLESRAVDAGNQGAAAAQLGRLDEAQRHFETAAAWADSAGSPDARWAAWLGLGDVAEKRRDYEKALNWNNAAVALIDTMRAQQGQEGASVTLFARRLFAYEALIHLLGKIDSTSMNHAYAAEAFRISEQARARAFLDRVGHESGKTLVPIELKTAQRLVPDGRTAMLVYSVGDSSTALWVVKRDSWRHVMLPPRRALRTQCEILRRALGDPKTSDAASTRRAARVLYQRLIAPVEGDLNGVKRLIVAPDGPLALIPFEALLTADVPAEGEIPKSVWMVQRYELTYVPSTTVLAELAGSASSDEQSAGIVAVADPRFAPDSVAATLPRLPHTAEEVEALRALSRKRPFTALTGADATRESFLALPKLSQARVIHIATHGTADEADPRRSGLWLAAPSGQTQPGFLALPDIERLHLRAGLVTLSACETGLGRLETGEGVIGLTRAFMTAGARSVMVSLWKVNDQSTARLMSAFYQQALPGKSTCDAALARAKRKLLDDPATRAPFHWAPFVLQGSAQSLN